MQPHALFVAYRDSVHRYLARIVGADEAPDLTQEVFLRAARANVPETAAGERAWIFRVARNLALNHQRDRARRPVVAQPVEAARPPAQETAAAMRQALARLAPLDRDVFVLREVVGLSYGEIADACELTTEAVRARLHRSRHQLRTLLAPVLGNGAAPLVRLHEPR